MSKRKVISKEELKKIGEKIFSENGYFLTKVSDIVKTAGVSQGTFYLNYESKKELFIDILKDFRDSIIKIVNDERLKNLNPADALILSQKLLFTFFMENKRTTCLVYREGYVEKDFSEILEEIHKLLTESRAEYLKEIFKEKLSPADREILSYILGGILRSLFIYFERDDTDKEVYEKKIDQIIGGFISCVANS
ncbi:MAG: TetR/AcrR family transcriptional regulator [Proteobacteria bacterium]|nr:TetR/AcrR family transcriptional regulator [Pseudomonadota bacterium]